MDRFAAPTINDEMAECVQCGARRHYTALNEQGYCAECEPEPEDEAMTDKELRDLEIWIAEHVFGATITHTPQVPKYTSDADSAMEVLEKCSAMTTASIRRQADGGFCIWFDHPPLQENYVMAKTLPLSICLFARKLFSKE